MRKQLREKYAEAEPAMDTLFQAADEGYKTEQATLDTVRDSTRNFMLFAAAFTGILFTFFAWLLARSITTPVSSLADTMIALAGGDKTVAIPSVDNKDEIGDVARAVLVFKENMIRNDEMQAQQEAERAAKEKRAEKLAALTEGFDTKAREVLQTVASAATELQQTAEGMAATAEQTNQQASSVATASNQATANVQTVATASEELSASIAEIGRQVNQSAKATKEISSQIPSVQEETRDTVAAIDSIMQVISEISDISTTIASAVEEQGVSTQEIARNVQQAAQGTQEVNTNISGVTQAAASTGAASEQMLDFASQLSAQAQGLRSEVERFLADVRAA